MEEEIKATIESVKAVYSQGGDEQKLEDQSLEIEWSQGVGESYFSIKTGRWSFTIPELIETVCDFAQRVETQEDFKIKMEVFKKNQ